MTDLPEIRLGRNFVRPNDIVKVKPSKPGRRDGFLARVKRIFGPPVCIEVYGGPAGREKWRTLPLARIERVSQTVNGKPRTLTRGDAG